MSSRYIGLILAVLISMSLLLSTASAQQSAQMNINGKQRAVIVDSVALAIESTYVFPDKGKAMAQLIRQNQKKKAYDTISTLGSFAFALTTDLRSVTHDLHIGVRPIPPDAPSSRPDDTLTDDLKQQVIASERKANFGFQKVEILDGNIGYVDMRSFCEAEWAGPTAIAAMNFVANTNAVIFDMRYNGGGDPSMCQLLMSYFLDKPTHINSFYERRLDSLREFWTYADVSGPRMTNTPVYILTSNRTFSCAEEFSYDFQSIKRGTVVGETTGGGAHPVASWDFADLHLEVRVPYGRAINPVTKTNWEGVGVKPDIESSAEAALSVAHVKALEEALSKTTDEATRSELSWALDNLKSQYNPVVLNETELTVYAGTYGPRTISVVNGVLQSRRPGGPVVVLLPMGADLFRATQGPDLRMKFVRDGFGKIAEVQLLTPEGMIDRAPRQPN